ncbi:MAG: DUF4349 domain-containing protein [Candidatus Omnitrophota bacterium]
MNKCFMFEEISRYVDNELRGAEKEVIEKHLKECALCGRELARLQALSEKLKSWHVPDLDADFQNAVIKEAVRRETERGAVKMKKHALSILVPSGVAVTLLIVMFFGQMYTHRGLQGRLRQAADDVGDQSGLQRFAFDEGKNKPVEYEPYYTRSDRLSPGKAMPLHSAVPTRSSSQTEEGWNERSVEQAGVGDYSNSAVIVVQPALPATGEGDMIIRTAQIQLEVEDGGRSYKEAIALCNSLGGYIASSQFYKDEQGRDAGVISMRIPRDKFLAALDKFSLLGKVQNSSTSSQDVRQEYANLKSQLDAAMVVYNKMLETLQKRQVTIPEAVRLESQLSPVLARINGIKNRLESLHNAVSFTTIELRFREAEVSGKLLKEMRQELKERILRSAIKTLKFIVEALPNTIMVLIGGVCLIVAVLVGKGLVKRLFKRD